MKSKIIPDRLKLGDEIRVIAPSRSMSILNEDNIEFSKKRLENEGFKVTFSKNVRNYTDKDYMCATIEDRVEDLHEAFRDKNVKAILTVIGGYNSNQILDYIDYELIKSNPKIFCGFSDITALSNSIYAKTGLVTYSGVHFSSFGMIKGFEYSLKYFKEILLENKQVNIESSYTWSNDSWYKDQENRNFIDNDGMFVINKGKTEGRIIGGNLCTLNLLQGTEYMPDLQDAILFLEDDGLVGDEFIREFDRDLQSLLHCAKGKNIKGIVLGRAENVSKMNKEKWNRIIKSKKELSKIPIVGNANFGHTTPIFTFPIGGFCKMEVSDEINIVISN